MPLTIEVHSALPQSGCEVPAHMALGTDGGDAIVHHGLRPPASAAAHEIWRNLACLCEVAGATRALARRAYVRHAAYYPAIRDFLALRLNAAVAVIHRHADICRREVRLEIEGVYAIPRGGARGTAGGAG